jgi:hypothetical protein
MGTAPGRDTARRTTLDPRQSGAFTSDQQSGCVKRWGDMEYRTSLVSGS